MNNIIWWGPELANKGSNQGNVKMEEETIDVSTKQTMKNKANDVKNTVRRICQFRQVEQGVFAPRIRKGQVINKVAIKHGKIMNCKKTKNLASVGLNECTLLDTRKQSIFQNHSST
jgi:hypothetical protein